MDAKLSIVGNLTANAEKKRKLNTNIDYHLFTVACSKSKEQAIYVTCFVYGLSDKRAALLSKGSMIYAYGNLTINTGTGANGETEIKLILNIKDFEVLNHKI